MTKEIYRPSIRKPIEEMLATERLTSKQIAERIGRAEHTVARNLRELAAAGKAHICDWKQVRSTMAPIWTAGNKPHVPRPRITTAEAIRKQNYRVIHRAKDAERLEQNTYFANTPRLPWELTPCR